MYLYGFVTVCMTIKQNKDKTDMVGGDGMCFCVKFVRMANINKCKSDKLMSLPITLFVNAHIKRIGE